MSPQHTAFAGLPTTASSEFNSTRRVPWQIWVVVILLGLEGIGNLLSIPQNPSAAQWFAAKVIFIAGLTLGWRWIFVWFLAVSGLHVWAFISSAPLVAYMNLFDLLMVGSAWRYFFPKNGRGVPSAMAKPSSSEGFDPDFHA